MSLACGVTTKRTSLVVSECGLFIFKITLRLEGANCHSNTDILIQ